MINLTTFDMKEMFALITFNYPNMQRYIFITMAAVCFRRWHLIIEQFRNRRGPRKTVKKQMNKQTIKYKKYC